MERSTSVLCVSTNPHDILDKTGCVLEFLTTTLCGTGIVLQDNSIAGLQMILEDLQTATREAQRSIDKYTQPPATAQPQKERNTHEFQ